MRRRRSWAGRPAARPRRLWLLVIPLTLFLTLVASLAWADPEPNPAPGQAPAAPGTTAPPTPTPEPAPAQPDPPINTPRPGLTPAPPDGKPVEDLSKAPANAADGLLQPFDVKDQFGVPISAYTIDADTGDWNDFGLKIWSVLAQLFFGIAKWFIGFASWLIEWALDFGLAKVLVGPVDDIASTIRDQVINRMGLPALFLMFAGVYAGWHIMFKQRSRGFAEAGTSLIIAATATTVLLSPAQVLLGTHDQPSPGGSTMLLSQGGLVGKAKDFTLQISALVLSEDPSHTPAQTSTVSKPIKDALVDAFVVKPTQLMTYGQTFNDPKCAKAFATAKLVKYNYDQKGLDFWQGSRANTDGGATYNEQLTNAGDAFLKTCKVKGTEPQARKASADMAFSAAFVAVAALIVSILMILVTGGFLTAQGWLAFESIRGHWALCAGILPGGGRGVLWRWASAIVKALLGVVLAILFLAIFILVVLALIDADTGSALATKFIAIDIAAIAGLASQKRIKETARQVAVNLNRRLANARIGGSRHSVFNNYRYAETAPGLKQLWGEARGEARRVSQPLSRAGRSARQLWVGPPQNRRGGRVRAAARLATTAAAAVGTGGASAAAQAVAKQTLKKRLAAAAAHKMSQTRGGRATMATGKAAAAAGKYGWKATKFTALATVGAPVGIPRGVAATKRGAAAAKARADQVKTQLAGAKARAAAGVNQKVGEAKAFKNEYVSNVATAGRFIGRHGANIQIGLASPISPPMSLTTPGQQSAVSAPQVPGPPNTSDSSAAGPMPTPGGPAAGGPSAIPTLPGVPLPATAPGVGGAGAAPSPARGPRRVRRATRPAGPPRPHP
ncbi:hypothetical protein OG800_49360 (plasmid) [Streptomyces sp. NBC_00445]|uniref:hypothetical protein n=1 Tax=Streptomyces sp. NBC_00445 TaxID=2975745 RepID=UPI002E2367B8